MSSEDLHSSPDGRLGSGIVDVELDVKLLGSFIEGGEQLDADDSELLVCLESADTMASGVEARLDEILGTLDDLLAHLEPKDGSSDTPRSESRSKPRK